LAGPVRLTGMIESDDMDQIPAERDFDLIEPLVFPTANPRCAAPAHPAPAVVRTVIFTTIIPG